MKGIIAHYRQNRHTVKGNHIIVLPEGCTTREEATKLVGKTVTWNTGKQDMVGKISSAHGNSGAVRVVFDRGMPGQALSQQVTIA